MESIRIEIPNELFAPAESSHFEGDAKLEVLKAGPDLYSFAEPLAWQVEITNTGDAFLVMGTVEGEAVTSCARCLEDVRMPFVGEIEGYFLINEGDFEKPEDIDEEEFEVLGDDNAIDMMPLITAALLLEVPLVPLCDDECKGMCLSCGANLNEGDCGCAEAQEDEVSDENPFAALKGLKFD